MRIVVIGTLLFSWAMAAMTIILRGELASLGTPLLIGAGLGLVAGTVASRMVHNTPAHEWSAKTELTGKPVGKVRVGWRMTLLGIVFGEVGLFVLEQLGIVPGFASQGGIPFIAGGLGASAGGAMVGVGVGGFRPDLKLTTGRKGSGNEPRNLGAICARCGRAVSLLMRGGPGGITVGALTGLDCFGFECSDCGRVYCDCSYTASCKCGAQTLRMVVLRRDRIAWE